jgi:hypothetical protein
MTTKRAGLYNRAKPALRPLTAPAPSASARYRVGYDGPRITEGIFKGKMMTQWAGILDVTTGVVDQRIGFTARQVEAEVARLNAGLPVSAKSQGKGRRPRYAPLPSRLVEVLLDYPATAAVLQDAAANKRALSHDEVRNLFDMFPRGTWLELPADEATAHDLVKAVRQQLNRTAGIRRGMADGAGVKLNDARHEKRQLAAAERRRKGIDAEHAAWMKKKRT